mmetsp:Transcript_64752/g.173696  ORF Transcript_64752/g.173696 Transcript_64752/m.173696 type:complete len:282 (+) Transcript_64752:54-899(+)
MRNTSKTLAFLIITFILTDMQVEVEVVSDHEFEAIESSIQLADNLLRQKDHPTEAGQPVDIEDLAAEAETPLELWGRSSIFVTSLCMQEWCEMQLDFSLRIDDGEVEETVEMRQGREQHLEAELEIHELQEVSASSPEDVLGLRLLNLRSSALQLCTGGLAREVPVFGDLAGLWVTGVIDELCIDQQTGEVLIRELKTRGRPDLPSAAQQRCTHLQLMAYKRLWDALVANPIDADLVSSKARLDVGAASSRIAGHGLCGKLQHCVLRCLLLPLSQQAYVRH